VPGNDTYSSCRLRGLKASVGEATTGVVSTALAGVCAHNDCDNIRPAAKQIAQRITAFTYTSLSWCVPNTLDGIVYQRFFSDTMNIRPIGLAVCPEKPPPASNNGGFSSKIL